MGVQTGKGSSPEGSSGRKQIIIVLLKNDLRVHDQAHFHAAHTEEGNADVTHVLPLYVFDERTIELSGLPDYQRDGPEARTTVCKFWKTGVFRARFQAEAVYDVKARLKSIGSDLIIRFGKPEKIVPNVIQGLQQQGNAVKAVYFQKEIAPEEVEYESALTDVLDKRQTSWRAFCQKQLIHPDDLPFAIKDTPDVFTPFRKRVEALRTKMAREPLPIPEHFKPIPSPLPETSDYGSRFDNSSLEDVISFLLEPLAGQIQVTGNFDQHGTKSAFPYSGGESSALSRLEWYFESGSTPPPVARYKQTRNHLLGHGYSTKMSPFLCCGSVSPRLILQKLLEHERTFGSSQNTYWVQFEMLWRDYFMFITEKYGRQLFTLGGFEEITDPKQAAKKVDEWHNWDPKDDKLVAWMKGATGVPFIDANILELLESGFMSNRGRQNVASFLTKDLYYDWRIGAEYFQSHLVDYDPSANYGNWQYVAGVGNDPRASRQFNPIKQGKDYDVYGAYVKHWLPQLGKVPAAYIHLPWLLNDGDRASFGLKKSDYPTQPIIEQDTWKPHYVRRDGDRSKMAGNPAERIRDASAGPKASPTAAPNSSARKGTHERSHGRIAPAARTSYSSTSGASTPPIAVRRGSGKSPVKHMGSVQAPVDFDKLGSWRRTTDDCNRSAQVTADTSDSSSQS